MTHEAAGNVSNAPVSVSVRGKTRRADALPQDLSPINENDFGYDQARHLLWRAGFGGTPDQIQTLASWGPEKAVDYLLNPQKIPFEEPRADSFDRGIMRPNTPQENMEYRAAAQRGDEDTVARFRRMRQEAERRDRAQMRDLQRWWLKRLIETPRPLEEKMTLFWHGHFATSYRTIEDSYHMYMQNQLFRSHAVGNYAELLHAIIRDPAMIEYLDNNNSRKDNPNENLARELMELFSLGVGNYTEQDIKEGARALTGYGLSDDQFDFKERFHDFGSKRILGRVGNLDGADFVNAILSQGSCARYMAEKLYDFFARHVANIDNTTEPAQERFIARLANSLRSNNYSLKPTLRTLFLSKHFYHPKVMNDRIKSPVELAVGAIRSLNTPTRDLDVILQAMDLMGQSLFYPPSVKGWDGGRAWINTSTMFVRQNLMNFLLTGKLPQGYDGSASTHPYDPEVLIEPLAEADPASASDPQPVVDYLLRFTIGEAPSYAKSTLEAFCKEHGGTVSRDVIVGLLLLVSAMPEYQLC